MKRTSLSGMIAAVLVVVMAVPALAWHVKTGEYQQGIDYTEPDTTVRVIGPSGDPFYRIVIKVKRSKWEPGACEGWVKVPNQNWVGNYKLYVQGTNVVVSRGQKATLSAGDYVGRWSNDGGENWHREKEEFTIRCDKAVPEQADPNPQHFTWRYVGRNGVKKARITVPEGCTYRSPWRFLKGNTRSWVWSRDDQRRIKTFRVAPPGYYGKLWKGFTPGLDCDTRLVSLTN